MNKGAYISGIGHGAFLLWALAGGFFLSARDPLPVQASDVSLISSEEFAALALPDQAPIVPFDAPQPVVPEPQDAAPELEAPQELSPEPPTPEEVVPPEAETAPVAPPTLPTPQAEVDDEAPELSVPQIETSPVIQAKPDDTPTPAPSPRVAPVPAAPSEPDTEIADTVAPEVLPDEAADTVAQESPATAPEEAATEIVTEAETPSSAPLASLRPMSRPTRTKPQVATAQPPKSDPVTDAVADAIASTTPEPTPARPTGPPLNSSERAGFRVAVGSCWSIDPGSAAARVTVTIGFSLDRSGKLVDRSLEFIGATGGGKSAVNVAFEAARRAIIRCGLTGYDLPLEKYSRWKDIEMTFNPEGMRIK